MNTEDKKIEVFKPSDEELKITLQHVAELLNNNDSGNIYTTNKNQINKTEKKKPKFITVRVREEIVNAMKVYTLLHKDVKSIGFIDVLLRKELSKLLKSEDKEMLQKLGIDTDFFDIN